MVHLTTLSTTDTYTDGGVGIAAKKGKPRICIPPLLQSPIASSSSWITYIHTFWYLRVVRRFGPEDESQSS